MVGVYRDLVEEVRENDVRVVVDDQGRFAWGNGVVSLVFSVSETEPVKCVAMSGRGMEAVSSDSAGQKDAQPIVEVRSSRDSGGDNRLKLAVSATGLRLRFVEAYANRPDPKDPDARYRLVIEQQDVETGLQVLSKFEAYPQLSAVRCSTILSCDKPLPIEAVSSMNMTMPIQAAMCCDEDASIHWGDSSWDLENEWHCETLRATTLKDRNQIINPGMSSARFAFSSTSTWSTGEHQPAGIVTVDSGAPEAKPFSFMWQIEHNGAWEWEIGENDPGLRVSAYGPEYDDHQWFTMLGENNDFETVPVSFTIRAGEWQKAVWEMTAQRRALHHTQAIVQGRADHEEHARSVVVYNDYMNTLFGDPTLEKELPLIEGASKVGADIFCIDAGWYDSNDGGWWDMVGEWEPSINRFLPIRFAGLVHDIQSHGMGVGLWLEPEVIGVKSPIAKDLPDSAFFCRHGERVADQGRYHLDFRSPIAREHATATVDRLIHEFDVKFFKFDYNTMPGPGSDLDNDSVGDALLQHCRAVQDWIDSIRKEHPEVVIENCGSGAMRADYAMLSRLDLQSTSDQCDPLIYAAIAAGAGMTIPPEQQGNWGYAQEEMDDETAVLTLAAGVLGRLYLSGFINRMGDKRLGLVREAISLQRGILNEQPELVPWWPYEIPSFNGSWLVYGLHRDEELNKALGIEETNAKKRDYITIWRRSGVSSMYLPMPEGSHLRQIFPSLDHPEVAPDAKPWKVSAVDSSTFYIEAAAEDTPSARIFEVTYD